ncbi:MAG TPA: hypothetical protein PLQ00_15465 [Thermoguttaceae bacterium]|nr:hypothetical protein [Thermoguttaceae bacterium]
MAGWVCHIVAFEGRASFPLWARAGQPTAPRRRRNAQGQILLERGICSYSQVLNFWYDAVREAIQNAGAIAWDQIPQTGENPPTEHARLGEPSDRPVVYWYYYAQNHWRQALRDIRHIISSFRTSAKEVSPRGSGDFDRMRLVLFGFSNGGDAVYQTAKALEREGIRVDLAITVDPVRKPLRGMGFMGFQRPENVARWINYYQRFDRRTLAGILPIVGRHVDGADENNQMRPEDFPEPKTRPKAHLWIPSLEVVRRRITDELTALLSQPMVG